MSRSFLPAGVLTALLMLSCSGTAPGILATDWIFLYNRDPESGRVRRELDLAVLVRDDDGREDLSAVTLTSLDRDWSWRSGPADWGFHEEAGELWLGVSGLTPGGDAPFPEGEYLLTVEDRSGQKSERRLDLSPPEGEIPGFPTLRREGEALFLQTSVSPLVLWFYDERFQFLGEVYSDGGPVIPGNLLDPDTAERAAWVYLYYQEEREGFGLKTGPFPLKQP